MYKVTRNTKETGVYVSLSHPAEERGKIDIPCGFLAHMLDLLAHRARFGLDIKADGDMETDAHHLTEDIGIVLGTAMKEMLTTENRPRKRYGWCLMPMDGSLVRVALDISGRGGLYWSGGFPTDRCGEFDLELVPEFFRGLCRESRTTMHISILEADNSHHAAEAVFKGVGLALDMALVECETESSSKGEWL